MAFIQVMEYETTYPDEVEALMDDWIAQTAGKRTATHDVHTKDRDHPGRYVDIVEFPSYEEAMRNSALPETKRISQQMRDLCSGGISFHNLDVVRDEKLATAAAGR